MASQQEDTVKLQLGDKVVELRALEKPSRGGQRRYRGMFHVPRLGTVYVTAYAGAPKAESPVPEVLASVSEALGSVSRRLRALEEQLAASASSPHASAPH